MKTKKVKVYCLRVRANDQQPWSAPVFYRKRKARDHDGSFNRIIGGLRTHSWDERLDPSEIEFADA